MGNHRYQGLVYTAIACVGLLAGGCQPSAESADAGQMQQSPEQTIALGNLQFIQGFRAGAEQAQSSGKPMLVFFTAEWCRFCHQMANEAFVQEQVVKLSDRFTCVMVDADAEPAVCREFSVQAYPTILFLSPDGVLLNRIKGKKPAHFLAMQMQSALQAVARRQGNTETTMR
ncbi:MAG: thioredoxin family protein [Pirellulales bacterium]